MHDSTSQSASDRRLPAGWAPRQMALEAVNDSQANFTKRAPAAWYLLVESANLPQPAVDQLLERVEAPSGRSRWPDTMMATAHWGFGAGTSEGARLLQTGMEEADQTIARVVDRLMLQRVVIVPLAMVPGSRPLVVGRKASSDVPLRHGSVSKAHAELHCFEDGRVELIDVGSKNGSMINDKVVTRSTPVRVGDRIRFGKVGAFLVDARLLWSVLDGMAK